MLPSAGIIADNEIDTFERGDLSPYSGDTTEHSVVQSPVYEGGFALQRDDTDFGAQIESLPGNGLDNYPERGHEFECFIRSENFGIQCDAAFRFGMQDRTHGYSVRCDFNSNDIQVNRVAGGIADTVDHGETFFEFQENEWYRMHVEWDDGSTFGGSVGDINYTVEELDSNDTATVNANDTNYSNGGVAFYADTTESESKRVWWDGARILNL